GPDFGFSGFRLHGLLNRPDYLDEIAVFQGASYFRAVGKGQGYGTSARGLAVKTAAPSGEEFPVFRAFYVEQPRAHVPSI
ncbi:glucan biosynthesis protein, partial [Klebsiella pneumoniae]|nr:glucan biosynthesis protein [Klebsiella pneumoniae]